MYKYVSIDLDQRKGITNVTREFCKAFYRSRDEFIKSGGEKEISLKAWADICGGHYEMVQELKTLGKYGYIKGVRKVGAGHWVYNFFDVTDVPKEFEKYEFIARNTKIVFIALAVYAQEKEVVKAPLETLSKVIGMKEKTIDKHLNILDSCDIITKVGKDTYQFNVWP